VDPDIELDLHPTGLGIGGDIQIDFAIEHLLKEIKKDARDLPDPPPIIPRPLKPVR
jgi:hypothetical protein